MDSGYISCVYYLTVCMHAHAKYLPNASYCVCLVVTKHDLKFNQNPFMDSGYIACARKLCPCVHAHIAAKLMAICYLGCHKLMFHIYIFGIFSQSSQVRVIPYWVLKASSLRQNQNHIRFCRIQDNHQNLSNTLFLILLGERGGSLEKCDFSYFALFHLQQRTQIRH